MGFFMYYKLTFSSSKSFIRFLLSMAMSKNLTILAVQMA